jgi:hypothetical protein
MDDEAQLVTGHAAALRADYQAINLEQHGGDEAALLPAEDRVVATLASMARDLNPLFALPGRRPTRAEPAGREAAFAAAAARVFGFAVALCRAVNILLWAMLILLYFSQVDGVFPAFSCADGTAYCSRLFRFRDDCAPSGQACAVSLPDTVPVLVLLTLMQFMQFYVRAFAKQVLRQAVRGRKGGGDDFDLGLTVLAALAAICAYAFLLLLFGLEAFALPFGTKQGEIAFAIMDMRGLGYTCAVAAVLVGFVYPSAMYTEVYARWVSVGSLGFIGLLSLLAVAVHLLVSGLWYTADNWPFVGSSLFFVAWESDTLAFRVVRSWFSALTILENILVFGLFNANARLHDEAYDALLYVPAWSRPLLLGPLFGRPLRT